MKIYSKTIDESLKLLGSDRAGLTFDEAKSRAIKFSVERIEKPKRSSLWHKFFAQFADLMIMILLASATVSFIIGIIQHTSGELIDGAIILAIVLMNAVFGMLQENKAEKSLESLEKMTQPEAILLRSGIAVKVPTSEIVPGDIVVLEGGSIVPADCRLIESFSLLVDESSLTGESVPAEKNSQFVCREDTPLSERKNMVFNGTRVVKGRALAVVQKVGKSSELGKIANVLSSTEKELTPLQKGIKDLGKVITYLIIGIAVVTFILEVVARSNPLEAFLTAVAIAIAAIPESMPAVITIIMSLGISRLAKQRVIVKHMHSVETLGSCDVICSDKTGTITQNKMQVQAVYCDCKLSYAKSLVGKDFGLLLDAMALCNDAKRSKRYFSGDPTEVALAEFAAKYDHNKTELEKSSKRIGEIPFDSERKLMSSINYYKGENVAFVKGAIDSLIPLCDKIIISGVEIDLTKSRRQEIEKINLQMSSRALRVLGFAVKRKVEPGSYQEEHLTFVGMIGMIDPPRKEVVDAVQKCKKAGMRPIMITGDHSETAFAIAKEIGMITNKKQILTGTEIDQLSEQQMLEKVASVSVFARVSPAHKVRIVECLKNLGHVVAMTGDGVNDAASMKKSNIGIGMGITGTDVTKQVADLIITDDNFATIVVAVEEGRKVYKNIQKTVKFLFSANMGELLALFFATIIFPQYTFLLPVQILFVNLITDSLPAIALGVEPAETNLMLEKPRPKVKGLFSDGHGAVVIIMGLVQTFLTIAAFCIGLYLFDESHAMSMAFYTLNIVQFFYLLSIRTEASIFKSNPFKNKLIIIAILFAAGIMALISLTPIRSLMRLVPLTGFEWGCILIMSLFMIVVSEICKIFLRRKNKRLSASK